MQRVASDIAQSSSIRITTSSKSSTRSAGQRSGSPRDVNAMRCLRSTDEKSRSTFSGISFPTFSAVRSIGSGLLVFWSQEREAKCHGGALAALALDVHLRVECLQQFFDDAQAKASPLGVLAAGIRASEELLSDARQILLRNADAAVDHAQHGAFPFAFCPEVAAHGAPFRRVLDRIADQVAQDGLQAVLGGTHLSLEGRGHL